MHYLEVKGINNLIIHDYGLGSYVVSMHIEGWDEENNIILNHIANEITYRLYLEIGCDVTIETDFLVDDHAIHDMISKKAGQAIQEFKLNSKIKSLRIVKSGLYTNVILVLSGSKKLQKKENQIQEAMDKAITSIDSNYRVITKLVIASLHSKSNTTI